MIENTVRDQDAFRVTPDALRSFTSNVLRTYGVPEDHADLTADVLVAADVRGIDSHGVSRLGYYGHKLASGLVNTDPHPRFTMEAPGASVMDADNGLGPVASRLAMDWCIEHARSGVAAFATVAHSNHYGIAGYWAMKALDHDMIGVSLTNATSLVAPTFGRETRFGTNPIAVAVPAGDEPPFVLDMATSTVSAGALQLAISAGEQIPEGWAIDREGRETKDPTAGFMGSLLPLGGTRRQGSQKGYGLAVMVDVFSALLSGAAWGPNCLSLTSEFSEVANVGHFFAALRIEAFRPLQEFKADMDEMIRSLRATPPAPGEERVMVAGEPEREATRARTRDGIPLVPNLVEALRRLADERGVSESFTALEASRP